MPATANHHRRRWTQPAPPRTPTSRAQIPRTARRVLARSARRIPARSSCADHRHARAQAPRVELHGVTAGREQRRAGSGDQLGHHGTAASPRAGQRGATGMLRTGSAARSVLLIGCILPSWVCTAARRPCGTLACAGRFPHVDLQSPAAMRAQSRERFRRAGSRSRFSALAHIPARHLLAPRYGSSRWSDTPYTCLLYSAAAAPTFRASWAQVRFALHRTICRAHTQGDRCTGKLSVRTRSVACRMRYERAAVPVPRTSHTTPRHGKRSAETVTIHATPAARSRTDEHGPDTIRRCRILHLHVPLRYTPGPTA